MKKFLIMSCGIAIISASAAFALELPDALQFPGLTVSGDVATGLRVDGVTKDKAPDDYKGNFEAGAEDVLVYPYSDSIDDGTPFRAQLVLQWERENLGVKTRFRYQPDNGSGSPPGTGNLGGKLDNLNNTVNKAFVWGSILDNMVKVSLGKGLDAQYGLFYEKFSGANADGKGTSTNVTDFDGKDGVRLDVTLPFVEGLSFGIFYGSKDLFAKAGTDPANESYDIDNADRRFVFGAKYVTDSLKIVASLYHNFYDWETENSSQYGNYWNAKIEELEDGDGYRILTPDYPNNSGYFTGDALDNLDKALPNTSNLLVGAQYAADKLTIDLSMAFVNLGAMSIKKSLQFPKDDDIKGAYKKGDYNPFWRFAPKIKAAYAIDDKLTVALALTDLSIGDLYWYEETGHANTEDDGAGHLFPITINPSVAYAINDDITTSVDLNFKINSNGSDQFGFGVKPAAEFSLGSGATFVVYDELTFWAKSNDDADFIKKHGTSSRPNYLNGGNQGVAGTTNTLQFDFVWTF
jgi:hypothetical protein